MRSVEPCQWEIWSDRLHTTRTPGSESYGAANWFVCKNSTATTIIQHLPLFFFPWSPSYPQTSGKTTSHQHLSCFSTSKHREHHTALQGHRLGLVDVTVWWLPSWTAGCRLGHVFFWLSSRVAGPQPSHCPGPAGLPTESARQRGAAHPSKALLGANSTGELYVEKLSLPLPHTPLQGSFLQEENLEQEDKEHFQ